MNKQTRKEIPVMGQLATSEEALISCKQLGLDPVFSFLLKEPETSDFSVQLSVLKYLAK